MKRAMRTTQVVIFSFLILISLSACKDSKPNTPKPNVDNGTGPSVIRTSPRSEQRANVSDIIKITFDEAIQPESLTTNVVSIIPLFSNGELDYANRLSFDKTDLVLTKKNTVLKVLIDNTALQQNTSYQVTVKDVEDYSLQSMVGSCVWKFSVGIQINEGKQGLCGALSGNTPPSKIDFALAFTTGGTAVSLRWDTPSSGNPSWYTIEEIIDNQGNAIVIEPSLAGDKFRYDLTDVVFGHEHIYRITPVNSAGRGPSVLTNGVTTQDGIAGTKIADQALVSDTTIKIDKDSVLSMSVVISPDGRAIAFAENNRSSILSGINNGTVRILTKNIAGNWIVRYRLDTKIPVANGKFGNAIAFSPDGLTLAVGELSSAVGVVQLFTRVGLDWSVKPTYGFALAANRLVSVINDRSGDRLVFSPDGSTLAVSTVAGQLPFGVTDSGVVQLFHRSGVNWNSLQPSRGKMLYSTAVVKGKANYFGKSIAFSPDSSTLAIAEHNADVVASGDIDVSVVHLFQRNGLNWNSAEPIRGPILMSQSPNTIATFGNALAFSPDGKTLAINDLFFGTTISEINGYLQLFTRSGLSWLNTATIGPVLRSQAPRFANYFGFSMAFSADNRFLAVGEMLGDLAGNPNSGNVQIFNRTGLDWSVAPRIGSVLSAIAPTSGYIFGINITFDPSKIGTNMIVGSNSDSKNLINVGSIQFFDSNMFIP